MSGISSKAARKLENKEKTFQGQSFDDDLGLNWIQFKWRNHDPQIGRFIEIDPLSDKYVYNSGYAFSENHVTSHVELEGLEKIPANGEDLSGDPKKLPKSLKAQNSLNVESKQKGEKLASEVKRPKPNVQVLVVDEKATSSSDVGHTAVQVGDKVYGYYPTDENNDGAYGGGELLNSKGTMSIESREQFDQQYSYQGINDYTLNVTENQAAKIENYLQDKAANPGTYSLFDNQCTSVAIKALNNGGITVNTNPLITQGFVLAPRLASPGMLSSALQMHENIGFVESKKRIKN